MSVLFEGELLADYHQIYVADVALPVDGYPEEFTDETVRRRVNVAPGVIVVQTARNMTVPFRVELHDAEPAIDLDAVDHAVECAIATSGEVVIAGLTDYEPDAARARVPAAGLRALVVSSGLGSLSFDGVEGEDAYVVHLWPAPDGPVFVRKPWIEG